MTSKKIMVFSSPPGGELDAKGVFKDSFDMKNIGLEPVDNLVIYASPTGSDSKDGLTPSTAVQTLRKALQLVKDIGWNLTAKIQLLAGNFPVDGTTLYFDAPLGGTQKNGPLKIVGTMQTVFLSLTVDAVSGGGFNTPITIDCKTAVTSSMDGNQVRFTSGALSGKTFIIGAASGTSFAIMNFFTPPAPGDTLTMSAPVSQITFQRGMLLSGAPVLFQDLDLVLPDFTDSPTAPSAVILQQGGFYFSGTRFIPRAGAASASLLAFDISIFLGELVYLENTVGVAFIGANATSNLFFGIHETCNISLRSSYVRNTFLQARAGSTTVFQNLILRSVFSFLDAASVFAGFSQILESLDHGIGLVDSTGNALIMDISDSAGNGVDAKNSSTNLNSITSITPSAGPYGLSMARQSRGQDGGGCSVTGATADVKLGANAAATWGQIQSGAAAFTSDFASPTPQYCTFAS